MDESSDNWPGVPAENSLFPGAVNEGQAGRDSNNVLTNIFIIMIVLTTAISFFVLFDQWLYQNQYERLMNVWDSGHQLQVQLDREDRRMISAAVGGSDQGLVVSESNRLERRIEKLRFGLADTTVSRRYYKLTYLKKELNVYLRDADRLVRMRRQAQKETIGIDKAMAMKIRAINRRLYVGDASLADLVIAAAPRNRPPLSGLINAPSPPRRR